MNSQKPNITSISEQPKAANDNQQDFSIKKESERFQKEMMEKVRSSIVARKYENWYSDKFRKELQKATSMNALEEKEKKLEKEFEWYTGPGQELKFAIETAIDQLVENKLITREYGQNLKKGIEEGILNSKTLTIPKKEEILKGELESYQNALKENLMNISEKETIMQEMLADEFTAGSEAFSFFTESEQKQYQELLGKWEKVQNGKLTADEYEKQMKTAYTQMTALFQARQKEQARIKDGPVKTLIYTFRNESWIPSLAAYHDIRTELTKFLGSSGDWAKPYLQHLLAVVDHDISTSLEGAAEDIGEKRAEIADLSGPEAEKAYKALLQEVDAIPSFFIAIDSGLAQEVKLLTQEYQLTLSPPEFLQSIQSQRVFAEQYLDWDASLDLHQQLLENLQTFSSTYPQHAAAIAAEENALQQNIQLCESELAAAENEGNEESPKSPLEVADWVEEHLAESNVGLDAKLALIALAADRVNQRSTGQIEETRTTSVQQFYEERIEDARNYEIDETDEEGVAIDHEAEKIVANENHISQIHDPEQDEMLKEAVMAETTEVNVSSDAMRKGSTELNAKETKEAIDEENDILVTKGDSHSLSSENARRAIGEVLSADMKQLAANDNIKASNLQTGVDHFTNQILKNKITTRQKAVNEAQKIAEAA